MAEITWRSAAVGSTGAEAVASAATTASSRAHITAHRGQRATCADILRLRRSQSIPARKQARASGSG
jgi:hypothetical protein